jgi:hypothetical protein
MDDARTVNGRSLRRCGARLHQMGWLALRARRGCNETSGNLCAQKASRLFYHRSYFPVVREHFDSSLGHACQQGWRAQDALFE